MTAMARQAANCSTAARWNSASSLCSGQTSVCAHRRADPLRERLAPPTRANRPTAPTNAETRSMLSMKAINTCAKYTRLKAGRNPLSASGRLRVHL